MPAGRERLERAVMRAAQMDAGRIAARTLMPPPPPPLLMGPGGSGGRGRGRGRGRRRGRR